MAIRIVVAGEIFIDQVLSGFSEWPRPGEESYATSLVRELGGGAPHTAAGLARLGWDVVLAGAVGKEDGVWVRERLTQLGVDATHLQEIEGEPTGTTIAISSPADRAFFTYRGANKRLEETLAILPSGGHLHLACPCDAVMLRELCGSAATVSIDAGWNPEWLRDPAIIPALRNVAWFLPNEREAACMTGESEPIAMLSRFTQLGVRAVVKLGVNGSALMEDDGRVLQVPAFGVEPVDTTGAGDNFDAGFLDAWLRREPPAEWLRAGNFCGALSTRAMGGMNGFPTREEITGWASK